MMPVIPVYTPQPLKKIFLKSFSAIALGLLGLVFVKTNHSFLAVAAYVCMIIQLVYIFRLRGRNKAPEEKTAVKEPSTNLKIISILCVTASFFLYYFAFTGLQAYNIKISVIFFALGSLLFGMARAGESYFIEKPEEKKGELFTGYIALPYLF